MTTATRRRKPIKRRPRVIVPELPDNMARTVYAVVKLGRDLRGQLCRYLLKHFTTVADARQFRLDAIQRGAVTHAWVERWECVGKTLRQAREE